MVMKARVCSHETILKARGKMLLHGRKSKVVVFQLIISDNFIKFKEFK